MTTDGEVSVDRDEIVAQLERDVCETRERCGEAESALADAEARAKALGRRSEETLVLLSETRAELRRVTAERDDLQKRLTSVEGMQTETVTLHEDQAVMALTPALPSIDELMSSLDWEIKSQGGRRRARLSGQEVEQPEVERHEMISPEEIVDPDDLHANDHQEAAAAGTKMSRLLVCMGTKQLVKYPISKEVMTIGRTESADIQIEGQFISRIHARVISMPSRVLIEDAGSRNGLRVNTHSVEQHERHSLRHGDVIRIGDVRLMFVEMHTER